MTQIKFQQTSPPGGATLDSKCLLVDTDGRVWVCSGRPGSQDGLTPLGHEQAQALYAHFGADWTDALNGMTALDDD